MNRNECDSIKGLLMGLMDQELSPEESQEVNTHLVRCPACQEEYEQIRKTSAKLGLLSFREPQDEVLGKLWKNPFHKITLWGGLGMTIGGYVTLMLFALVELARDKGEPLLPKLAVAAMVIGFFMLLFLFIWERMRTYQTDPYKHIKR